jgi:hypothetical protein
VPPASIPPYNAIYFYLFFGKNWSQRRESKSNMVYVHSLVLAAQ